MSEIKRDIDLLRRSGRFASEEEFLEEAFRALLDKRPELRVELAVERYKTGDVSLNRAAEISGLRYDYGTCLPRGLNNRHSLLS
ncbi:UPF0175 family protein [Halorussus halobius]|uniref:UPF0175 family protein n=1 Tax=Halorussus halobius TaxID=1710537 RepID=UPI00143CD37F|nr:UPF0175 family protein [Halorussus halobius]